MKLLLASAFSFTGLLMCCNSVKAVDKASVIAQIREAYISYAETHMRTASIRTMTQEFRNGKITNETGAVFYSGYNRSIYRTFNAKTNAVSGNAWVSTRSNMYHIQKSPTEENAYVFDHQLPNNSLAYFEVHRCESGIVLPFSLFEISTFDYMALPDLTIVSVGSGRWKNHDVTKVVCTRTIKGGVKDELYFDAKHPWLLRANVLSSLKTNKVISTYQVEYQADGVTPANLDYFDGDKLDEMSRILSVKVLEFVQYKHPTSVVSFSQFNLPEPEDDKLPAPSRNFFMPMILLSAIICMIGLFFAYIRRRYFPRAVALPPAGTVGS